MINLPELYYSPDNDKLWMKDARSAFVSYRKGAVSSRLEHEFGLSPKDSRALFAKTYKNNVVDLVTPIGGLKMGMHMISGNKILVPKEQRRIDPIKGDWEVIRKFMIGMLGDEQFEWYKDGCRLGCWHTTTISSCLVRFLSVLVKHHQVRHYSSLCITISSMEAAG